MGGPGIGGAHLHPAGPGTHGGGEVIKMGEHMVEY